MQVKRLSPWESWREAPERARTLAGTGRRGDSIALAKGLPIAVSRLLGDGLALSVIASQCHLSHRERLWQVGPLPTGRPRRNMAQKGGPCYRGQPLLDNAPCQAAAGLDSRALQSTKQISFARPEETCPACQRLPLWGSWREAPERARPLAAVVAVAPRGRAFRAALTLQNA